jgi:hypothetical protein
MSDIGKVGKCWEWVICLNASRSGILGSTCATSFGGKSDGPGCDDDETSIDEPLLSAARRHRVRFFRCSLRSTLLLLGCRATFNFVINRLLSSRTRASECWTERSAWLLKFAKRAFSYSQSPSRSLFRRIRKTELDLFNYSGAQILLRPQAQPANSLVDEKTRSNARTHMVQKRFCWKVS